MPHLPGVKGFYLLSKQLYNQQCRFIVRVPANFTIVLLGQPKLFSR